MEKFYTGTKLPRGHLQRHGFPPQMCSSEARDHTHRHVHTLVHAHTHRHTCARTHRHTHTHTELGALLRFQSPPSGRDGDRLVCRAATATGTAGRHQTPTPGQGTCGPRLTWARALRAAPATPVPAGLAGCEQASAQSQCDPAIQRGAMRGDPCTQKPLSWETPSPSPQAMRAAGGGAALTRKVG